jgi:hypothetical protein
MQLNVEAWNAQAGTRRREEMEIEIKAGPYFDRLPFTLEGLRAAIEFLKAIEAREKSP